MKILHTSIPFAVRFRKSLERHKISQKEAAEILRVSLGCVEAWLAGEEKTWGRVPSYIEQSGVFTVINNWVCNRRGVSLTGVSYDKRKPRKKWLIIKPDGDKVLSYSLTNFLRLEFGEDYKSARQCIYKNNSMQYKGYFFEKKDRVDFNEEKDQSSKD